ncbi:MAG: PH domain-containing protein [Anaerolineales bacterium]
MIPTLIYRAYALRKANYILERDGIHLVWGLRAEDIPITDVLWVHPAEELEQGPRKPWLTLPGAILGSRRLPEGGQIEYMASSSSKLVYIATHDRIYAVSPEDREDFIHTFQRFLELGSLRPIAARSVHPSFLLARVWALKPLRYLILAGLVLSLALLIWVSLVIPSREGFFRDRLPAGVVFFPPGRNSGAIRRSSIGFSLLTSISFLGCQPDHTRAFPGERFLYPASGLIGRPDMNLSTVFHSN